MTWGVPKQNYKNYDQYQIGIDAGSKTIKVCLSDVNGRLVLSLYRRHQSNIRETLTDLLTELRWRYGSIAGTIGVTGSAGIGIARALGLPFVQEVVATTEAVKQEYPQADCVIELGGEDAKIIYLSGPDGVEQRMNATCAGGTGGFIDTIAYMLGTRTSSMSNLALSATTVYPIASRCAVFAQTDIRPLLNAGAKTSDLAASALDAVVRQTIGGLACGRPITGTVVFLGGPCEFVPNLVQRFRRALNLDYKTGIKPDDAQFFTARGAGMYGARLPQPVRVDFSELLERLQNTDFSDGDIQRLQPLFSGEDEIAAFKKRHGAHTLPKKNISGVRGPLYLGFDAGSTTVKLAVVDQEGNLVYTDYRENEGDVLKTASDMLASAYRSFPHMYKGAWYVHVAHAVATGYGEELLKAGLGVDSGVVETMAHVKGALWLDPETSFVLDIGGQDMKAIWVKDGLIQNTVLNEACSSGCGSFISGTAYSLKVTKDSFAEVALLAPAPVDLGTKCTVFMSSRVKHAQKTGATVADLAAGCAYSVVKNALFRIIGINNLESLGDHIVVQGGTFMNNAILRAFELITGKQVIRPAQANLMGAIGCAFLARERAMALGEDARSTLISPSALVNFEPKKQARQCEGCENQCTLTLVDFGSRGIFVGGNKCGRALELYGSKQQEVKKAPNAWAAERALLARYDTMEMPGARGSVSVGIMNTLLTCEYVPFWHTFFRNLGFSVKIPHVLHDSRAHCTSCAGSETVPSESVCHAAKCSHSRLNALSAAGANWVFMPLYQRGVNCSVSTEYALALRDGAVGTEPLAQSFLMPQLCSANPRTFRTDAASMAALQECILKMVEPLGEGMCAVEISAAFGMALAEQKRHEQLVRKANQRVLAWVNESPDHKCILLAGRPYHVDADNCHEVDEALAQLGLGVLSPTVITLEEAPRIERPEGHCGWKKSSHLLRLANYACQLPRTELVCLQSFGCLYDSVNLNDVEEFLHKKGHLFTALKMDEIADMAHVRIRLRTLAENLAQLDSMRQVKLATKVKETERTALLRVDCALDQRILDWARQGSVEAFSFLEVADVEAARTYTKDLCFTTAAIVGRCLRILAADEHLEALTLPDVCHECVLEAVPSILRRVTGRELRITWVKDWACHLPECATQPEEKPLVGLLGTAPLCFDSFLNDNLAEAIKAHGCEPVFPQVESLMQEDVRYLEQLERFYDKGVRTVVYLQSFGCLKGHVRARGALHELADRFPGMHITVLDYDPEASALNRENRVLLTLAQAQDRKPRL